MSDDKDRGNDSLVTSPAGEIVVRSASLERRGLSLLDQLDAAEDSATTDVSERALDDAADYCRFGYAYLVGEGVPQDDARALQWYRRSAEQGHAGGQYSLGMMYKEGRGVAQDYIQGADWFRKSAEQGNEFGQSKLGGAYFFGLGVQQDFDEAYRWCLKAAGAGDPASMFLLSILCDRGLGVPDYVEAYKWKHWLDAFDQREKRREE